MIQAFQKFSQSRVAKVFLAIVALSFMTFFGGGSWFRPHDPNAVVAEVGDLTIGRYDFAERVQQQIQRLTAESEGKISREQILNAGVPQMVLGQMIQEILLNLESKNLGITVSDEAIREQIQSIKAFQKNGVFDRNVFTQILRSLNMSESAYIEEVRGELTREQLADAIVVGTYLPDMIMEKLFEAQYQFRQASMFLISPDTMPVPQTPSDAVLEAFYNDNQKEFKTPELRTLTVFLIDPIQLVANLQVTEDDIQALYEAKKESFSNKPLSEVKPSIIAELQKDKANEAAFKLTQELDDKIAGGATLEELAPTVSGGKLLKLENINRSGLEKGDSPSPHLPKDQELAQEILQVGFALDEASDTPFTQTKAGDYYMVRVDKVSPPSLPTFAEIKDRVLKLWIKHEQHKVAQNKAEGYVQTFNKGERKAASMMTSLPQLSLSEASPEVADEVKNVIFSLRPQGTGLAQTKEGFVVVTLNRITSPTGQVKEKNLAGFKEKILEHYKNDLFLGYVNALRIRYPVKINSAAIKALFPKE
ncbi:MAG: SurA N-terminal domain-containing protein [Alphaproteobacteria bacterium]|nr:SurA N-terminal domain-containing protein [Alphaproteobacteria bacterium]